MYKHTHHDQEEFHTCKDILILEKYIKVIYHIKGWKDKNTILFQYS